MGDVRFAGGCRRLGADARGERRTERLTYAKLKDSHSCGQFTELRVILRERTHVSVMPGHEARIFKALVNLSDAWGSAFVAFGGLPVE